jgi:hypothetical protein
MNKTLGPFTGRQLTTIICVLAVTIMFPFGAWAVSGSNAFITDARTGSHATVANGALTMNVAPTHNFVASSFTDGVDNNFVALLSPSSTHADVITQVDVVWKGMTPGTDYMIVALGKVDPLNPGNGPCGKLSEHAGEIMYLPSAQDIRQFQFNPGFVVPPGTSLCVGFAGSGQLAARAYGYFILKAAVVSPFLGRMESRATALNSFRKH